MDDTISVPLTALNCAIHYLEQSIKDVGGCDHDADICMCAEERALHELKMARGDEDAVKASKLFKEEPWE